MEPTGPQSQREAHVQERNRSRDGICREDMERTRRDSTRQDGVEDLCWRPVRPGELRGEEDEKAHANQRGVPKIIFGVCLLMLAVMIKKFNLIECIT
ncbi:hypothetical protein ElyMa_003473800 [Elysia marginata]|uniref:Uncharacterized protein n=1 Tax=Elysia marginata TaxID=1093978 RepID=A0AAV4EBS3_9GAST|nr:hypothetical protein ElyMa_003473800 [Elysia marginata]